MARNRERGHRRASVGAARVRGVLMTVVAFALVLFVIPLAFGLSDLVVSMATEHCERKMLKVDDFGGQYMFTAIDGGAGTNHCNVTNVAALEEQTVYTGEDLGYDYNQVVISYASPTEYATRFGYLTLQTNVSTQWMIGHKIVAVKLSLNTSSDKHLEVVGGAYTVNANGVLARCGWSGDGLIVNGVCMQVESYGMLNATYGHEVADGIHIVSNAIAWSYVMITIDQVTLLKADTFFDSATNSTFSLSLKGTGNTDGTSIINGDSIKFRIEMWSDGVGLDVVEIVVYVMGFGLIGMAVLASPYWNPTRGR